VSAARGRRANTGGKREGAGRKRGKPNKITAKRAADIEAAVDKAVKEGRAKPSERLWLLGDVAVNEIVKYKKAAEGNPGDMDARAEYKWWMEYARKAFCDAAPFWSPKLAAMAVRADVTVDDMRKDTADPRQRLLEMYLQMRQRARLPANMVSNTGPSSPGELEMTFSTSAVAVCCCSDSRSSLSKRVFSMAMTGLGGEVLHQCDLLLGEGQNLLAVDADDADQLVRLDQRHVRAPPNLVIDDSGSTTAMSATWAACMVSSRWVSVLVRPRSGALLLYSTYARGALCSATRRKPSPSRSSMVPKAASQMRVAFSNIAWKTGSSSPGELEMTFSTCEVAVCCSNASAICLRASASSRVRFSSCFFNSTSELGPLLTRAAAFVPVERSRVGLFAPLRAKVTSSAQSLASLPVGPAEDRAYQS
jgi:hypothetical protein